MIIFYLGVLLSFTILIATLCLIRFAPRRHFIHCLPSLIGIGISLLLFLNVQIKGIDDALISYALNFFFFPAPILILIGVGIYTLNQKYNR